MGKFSSAMRKIFFAGIMFCLANFTNAQAPTPQTLHLTDFAIWGGSAAPTSYNSLQGVFINNSANIEGNIGSNHFISIKNNLTLKGNIYSANRIFFQDYAKITGNIFANRAGTNIFPIIAGGNKDTITGNLTANGKIFIGSGKVTGQVAVPAPSTNYTGPAPSAGVINTLVLPIMPTMPGNTPFDNKIGTLTITNPTTPLLPGVYKKLALTGNKTLTFSGPGNYIFYEINNGTTTNKFVFDFKNTTTGTINIFVIKDARFGNLTVSTKNGNFPSRIYTEVHGNGSSLSGFSFDVKSPSSIPTGSYLWLGNVWAPNGGISVNNVAPCIKQTPQVIGALWSGKMLYIRNDTRLLYQAPVTGPSFIDPYYPPPASGKVNTTNNVIGAELFSLSQNPAPITSIPSNEIFILDNAGKVMIEVISKTPNDNTLKTQLINLGMTGILNNGPDVYIITGFFPITNLSQLNSNTRIAYVRPLYPPLSNAGQVTTQGDSTMRSNMLRERFGLDGSGIKIGVISDSYNSKQVAQNDVDQGDLPGIKSNGQPNDNPEPVQVLQDLPQRGNDEGRAMLQIVHDIAPQSKLAFRTGFLTAGDFASGIQELASPTLSGGRCDVIVDDITYVTEPFLRDGIVSQTVDQVAAQGVTYFSSAGNFGKQSYESIFNGVTNTSIIPTGQIHKFGATNNDIYQNVNLKPGSYTIVLQWSDEFLSLGSPAGVQTDMDLYIVGANGLTLFGFNRSNLFGDPFEVCPFTVKEETTAKIMVVRAAGTANVRFKYIIFRGDATLLDYPSGTSTIVGHPNANGAIAVGAMLYANIPQYTPVWPGVASFSSRGGTYTLQNNAYTQRNKPDFIAPNGVNTTVNLGGPAFNDGDAYPNFFGTSAAAPHAAGVAALLIQGRKKFNLQATVTPDEIRQQLQSSAGKFSNLPGNFSFEGGYGFIQADSAMQQIANAKPILDTLMAMTPGDQNGSQPFMVKLKGKYLTPASVIYANGSPVTTSVSPDKTEATAIVPPIAGGEDPPFQIYNSAKSPSNLDGGLSEPLYFFSSRSRVTIHAENKSRKYGQENPVFTAEVLIDGVPIDQTNITLADLKLDGSNLTLTSIATPASSAGLYGIFPSRTTPLDNNDQLLSQYSFSFVSGTLTVGKMLLKITPENKQIKYGDYPGDITYNYELEQSSSNTPTLLEEVKALHKKYLADNGLVVINDFNAPDLIVTPDDLLNMSTLASFQSIRNARKFVLDNGQLKPIANTIDESLIGDQRFIVDVAKQSLVNYKLDSSQSNLVQPPIASTAKGFLNLKALSNGNAKAAVPNGQLKPMVNGQLMAMVNGQLQALVNGQLKALVNNVFVDAADLVFRNGVLLALVNNNWISVTNGQLQAIVNGSPVTVDLSVQANGQLQAIANGQLMPLVNGQLQALVNGQLLAIVNGQLKALVNGQLMPLVNGQLMAIVNGQLKPIANGQLVAIINGQLMALVNGELEIIEHLQLSNGQLKAIVNGQLKPMVNGQLKAMVNGLVTDVPTDNFNIVNGQLQAIVNGQLVAMVNGQLLAIVNGQLKPLVNGSAVAIENVTQLANGQLKALVNGAYIPITNGQLQAMVNGQLQAMVNGQLMAIVNGELTFVVFENGQLKALVNGQLQPLVNGQLKAIVNGQLQEVDSYSIVNGQLQAIVNNETWVYPNGQLKALVNGQLKPLVNNFDVSGQNNNAKTLVLVDQDDINLQSGDVGGMFSVNMITGLGVGLQTVIPGAFINENFEVTYQPGYIDILPAPLIVKADDTTKKYGDANPDFTLSYAGFQYDDDETAVTPPLASSEATDNSGVGPYPINATGGSSPNYSFALYQPGTLTVNKKTLYVKANDTTKTTVDPTPLFNISYDGLVGDDTEDSVCFPFIIPPSPVNIRDLNRITTFTNVQINGGNNYLYVNPGDQITLTGDYNSVYYDPTNYCPGCITQLHIGMSNGNGGNVFSQCFSVSNSPSGTFNISFTAPTTSGVYYIEQDLTWWYYCGQFGNFIHSNNANKAIAVIIVNASNDKITATTTAQETEGVFPITLQGCSYYNPNYDVILQDGQITVTPPPSARSARITTATTIATNPTKNEIAKIAASKLYPNPGHGLVMLQLQNEVTANSQVMVYDAVGKLSSVPIKRIGDGKYQINVSALPKGLYIVNAKTLSGNETFRFVKL